MINISKQAGILGSVGSIGSIGLADVSGHTENDKINLLGSEIEVDAYITDSVRNSLIGIDFHGILYYKSCKNIGIFFPPKIKNYLETLLISYERNLKLDKIID